MRLGRLRILGVITVMVAFCPSAAAATPGNGWVVWGSNRTVGRHEIYLMKADGTGVTRLTHAGGKAPSWSRDGGWIAYNHTPDDSVHVIRWNGTGDKQLCATNIKQSNGGYLPPFWLHDKSGVLCRNGGAYHVIHPDTGATKALFKHSDFTQLASSDFMPGSLTHDNRYVLTATDRYRNGYKGSNGTFKSYWAAVIVDLTDKSKLYFLGPGCEPTTPPVGDAVFHVCGTQGFCPYGYDIARMSINALVSRSSYATEMANSDTSWGHEYFPRISNDNKWLAYGASLGCHDHDICDYEIFIHPLGSGSASRTRLTTHAKNDRWPDRYVGALRQPGPEPTDGGPVPPADGGVPPASDSQLAVSDSQLAAGDSQLAASHEALLGGCSLARAARASVPGWWLLLAALLCWRLGRAAGGCSGT